MKHSLSIQEIQSLPSRGEIRSIYACEVNIYEKRLIGEGRARLHATSSEITVLNSGNSYYFNTHQEEGYSYTEDMDCFLVDRKTGNAVMFWDEEANFEQGSIEFKNNMLKTTKSDSNFEIEKLTIEKETVEKMALDGIASNDFRVVAISRRGQPFLMSGSFQDKFDIRDCRELDFIEENFIIVSENEKIFRLMPIAVGSYIKLIDNNDEIDLFIFKNEEACREGVVSIAKNFSDTAPPELFDLAEGLKNN